MGEREPEEMDRVKERARKFNSSKHFHGSFWGRKGGHSGWEKDEEKDVLEVEVGRKGELQTTSALHKYETYFRFLFSRSTTFFYSSTLHPQKYSIPFCHQTSKGTPCPPPTTLRIQVWMKNSYIFCSLSPFFNIPRDNSQWIFFQPARKFNTIWFVGCHWMKIELIFLHLEKNVFSVKCINTIITE